jgi:large repetitive protein
MSNFRTKLKMSANRKTWKWSGLPVALPARGLRLASPLLLLFALLLGAASPVQAGTDMCSFYKKNPTDSVSVVDGNDPFVRANLPGSSFGIDMNCEFRNFPISSVWPNGLTPTLNFYTPDKTSIYLIVFDNVWFSGNMACANIEHKLWVVNSEEGAFSGACQDLMIPAETIAKQSPAATATIGQPFTYSLTLPSMNFRAGDPSPNDLGTITIEDDLAAIGADLTLVSLNAHYKDTSTAVAITPFPDSTNKYLHFTLPNIAAGSQVVVEVTAILNDTPGNVPGMQFINTAKWSFSRWIDLDEDGIQDANEYFNPLPGESGIATPMTIVAPNLVVNKTSPATALNLGDTAAFTIDVQNSGGGAAWNATIIDTLPAGMCATDPTATLSAKIVQADGVTLVKTLIPGTDFSVAYNSCQLNLAMTDAAGPNAPDQHLLINYRAQLDAGFTNDGATLTNVAGATQWFSAKSTYAGRRVFARTLTDGTPTIIDHQDSQTVTAALHGYYFEKTVANRTSQANPATTAAPGDTLRYTLRLFNVDQAINGIIINDLLDPNSFDLTSFGNVTLPAGASHTFNAATGQLRISGNPTPLNITLGGELVFAFDITLKSTLASGSAVLNQANLAAAGNFTGLSDDPYTNGVASPDVVGDENPTTVLIQSPGPLAKANSQPSATIGEHFTYRITVPAVPTAIPLYDVRILDNLTASAADLRFVSARVVAGAGLANSSGSDTNLVIEDPITGIDIPANGQAVIEVTVELLNTPTNRSGLTFSNSAAYTYNRVNGVASTQMAGGAGGSANMTVLEPAVTAASKTVRFVTPAGKPASEPARVGDVLAYTVTIPNSGGATAFASNVADTLPASVVLLPNSATAQINGVPVPGFVVNPTTLPSGALVWGRQNGDDSLDIPAGQSLLLTYQVTVVAVTGTDIINRVYADWTSLPGADSGERSGAGCPVADPLNNYCYGPVTVALSTVDNTAISKAVVGDSYAETPASTTAPIVRVGDTVIFELTLQLQEYTTQNVVVEDLLPAGMALESFAITAGPNFSYTLTAPPAAGATGTLRWQFGAIANPPSNNGTPLDSLVIRYVAQVVSAAPPVGVAYDPAILRDNLAKLSYTGGDPALFPARLTATARIDVRQPQMRALRKVDVGNARVGTGTLADPYRVNLASEVMKFQLSSCNDGLAPAYNVVLTDLLAPEFDQSDLTTNPPVVKIGATTLVAGTGYTYSAPARGGEMRVALLDNAPVNPGACVTVDYNLGFHTDLTVSKSWSNQARLAEYRSLPLAAPGRLYLATAPAQVWMTNLVSVDQLLATLVSPAEVTIGEEVTYQIRVPAVPMNAALANVVVTDTLHAALEYLSASAVDANGNPVTLGASVASGQVQLAIAAIPAGEQAIITLRTRVANNDSANAGTKFANTASYTYNGMPADAVTASTSGPLTIIEPLLSVTRTASTPAPQAGELLTYTLNLTAAGAGAGDNFAPVFDLSIIDSLGLGLAYVPGSATVNGAALADPLRNGADGVTAAQTLSWDPANGINIDVAEGVTVSVSYQVRVLGGVRPGQSLTSSASARWTGLNGDQSTLERTGSGTPLLNDYFTAPIPLTLTTPLAISFVKSVVNVTTGENPGAHAEPGDTLRYTLVLSNASMVAVTGVAVVDELAASFVPGSLQVLSISDANADRSNSNASGGINATGLVDIRNLTLAAQGNGNDTVTIEFVATLAPVLPSGTIVLNRAQLTATGLAAKASNETATLVSSAPQLQVRKSSQDLTGDSNVLRAGDTLRYTLTVENIGNEDATGVTLRDLIPAFTSYVANSTTLNGVAVADPAAGRSALNSGLLLQSPAVSTAGGMPADTDPANPTKIATVTFDVRINSDVLDATLIVNQGFVSGAGAGSGPLPDQPSDDPATAALDDPTRDIVGSLPLLDATKTVTLIDQGTAVNSVDPGDELLYTITVTNAGAIAATGVTLTDAMPAKTTYVANSTQLNGLAVLDPAAGVPALPAGLLINAAASPSGLIPAGASVTLTFRVRIDANVAPGEVISNQGYLASSELTTEPTDADGNDANGDQPTIVLVGSAQQLAVVKEVFVVGGGVALAGGQLEYVVRVSNNGAIAATDVVISDDLTRLAGLASYIAGSATLGGFPNPAAVTYSAPLLTATVGALPSGAVATLRFRVQINANVAIATTLTNSAQASWNTPAVTSPPASVSVEIGGIPGSAMLNGQIWHDANFDNLPVAGETNLAGWTVALYRHNVQLGSTSTDSAGLYHFSGLAPSVSAADQYELRFIAAGAGANTAKLGRAHSDFTNGLQQISAIVAASGSNLQNLNLPISPNGVVYDSVVRKAVAGASLALVNATTNTPLPGSCFADPAQQNQVTLATGYYKFDLNFSDPSCPPGAAYRLEVVAPPSGYVTPPSRIIPPSDAPTATPFSVAGCPVSLLDAVPATVGYCEAAPTAALPPLAVAARSSGTTYYLNLTLREASLPGASQLFNNHIPVDPVLDGAVAISKISALRNVSKGQLVPYTITVTNVFGVPLADLGIVDRFPAGFKYVAGSARMDGQPREPRSNGRELLWDGIELQFNAKHVLQLLLVVGAGVSEGEYVNRAQVINIASNGAASGEATATVRVIPDPTFDCSDVVGKVFDDRDLDGQQDTGELGLPGVRLVTARGLIATTDAYGRFHITCAVVPDELRGSNFILKMDDRSLPTGYRVTSENPLVQRATRGKMLRYNFGATIHRVVAIDISDGVFEPQRTELRLQWLYKLPQLLAELKKAPAVLRLSYLAEIEETGLVQARLEALKKEVVKQWALAAGGYRLHIETEVFWRRGGPP